MLNSLDSTAFRFILANAVETVSDAVIMLDEEQCIVFFNQGAERIFGYSAQEISGRPLDLLLPSRFVEGHRRAVQALATAPDGGKPMGDPLRVKGQRKDGTEFPAEGTISKVTQGGQALFLVILRDISMRLQAQESSQLWGRILERAGWGVVVVNADGITIEKPNAAFARMHGYAAEDLIGQPITNLFPIEARTEWHARILVADTSDDVFFESTHLRTDGSTFHVLGGVTAIRDEDGTTLHYVANIQDITERRNWEQALKEQEARLRSIIELIPVGIWVIDKAGRLVYVNEQGKRLGTGPEKDEAIPSGQTASRSDQTAKWIESYGRAAIRAATNGEATFNKLQKVERGDGRSGAVLISAVPIRDADETITGAIQVAQEVSELGQAYPPQEQRLNGIARGLPMLPDISRQIATRMELKSLLATMLTELRRVLPCDGAAIALLESGDFRMLDYQGPVSRDLMLKSQSAINESPGFQRALMQHEPVIIADIWRDPDWLRSVEKRGDDEMRALFGNTNARLVVPLTASGELIGVLAVDSAQPGRFSQGDANLALALANQAAVAIQNMRLHERAQQLGVLEERQRLAHELHDSVSQILYSIGVGSETALAQLTNDPAHAAKAMDYVCDLAVRGSAELRALIFGLRPDALEDEGLISGLNKHLDAIRARHKLDIRTRFCDEPELPLEKKDGLYRIALEALHNIVKHAHASEVDMDVECIHQGIAMEIRDNGVGFDVLAPRPGHLGLRSMSTRAENMGGRLIIESKPGAGTRLRVEIPSN